MRMVHGVTMILLLILSGCTAYRPLAEARAAAKAFDDLEAASQPLLDDLALAERAQGREAALGRGEAHTGAAPDMPEVGTAALQAASDPCPSLLLYGGQPEGMLTGSGRLLPFRQLLLFGARGSARDGLVSPRPGGGGRVQQPRRVPRRGTRGGRSQWPTAAAGGAGGFGAEGGQRRLTAGRCRVAGLATRHHPGREAGEREGVARFVEDAAPKVERLLAALREFSPELFTTLTEASLARFNTDGLENPELARIEATRIDGYRVAVSNYVVLLDRYDALLGDLVDAYNQPHDSITLAALSERAGELSAQAGAWRRTLASLRTGLH